MAILQFWRNPCDSSSCFTFTHEFVKSCSRKLVVRWHMNGGGVCLQLEARGNMKLCRGNASMHVARIGNANKWHGLYLNARPYKSFFTCLTWTLWPKDENTVMLSFTVASIIFSLISPHPHITDYLNYSPPSRVWKSLTLNKEISTTVLFMQDLFKHLDRCNTMQS